eukprot:scaffold86578_cov72-Phaeocystis_antarctica.AAC.1
MYCAHRQAGRCAAPRWSPSDSCERRVPPASIERSVRRLPVGSAGRLEASGAPYALGRQARLLEEQEARAALRHCFPLALAAGLELLLLGLVGVRVRGFAYYADLPQLELALDLLSVPRLPPHRRLDPLRFGEADDVVQRGGALVGRGGGHDLLYVSVILPGVHERGGGAESLRLSEMEVAAPWAEAVTCGGPWLRNGRGYGRARRESEGVGEATRYTHGAPLGDLACRDMRVPHRHLLSLVRLPVIVEPHLQALELADEVLALLTAVAVDA